MTESRELLDDLQASTPEVRLGLSRAGVQGVAKAIRSLRGSPALEGGRGRDAVDVDAVAELAAGVGTLLLESGLDLIELNPVAVHETGCIALDAIARFRTR